jgi:hypothetical protein
MRIYVGAYSFILIVAQVYTGSWREHFFIFYLLCFPENFADRGKVSAFDTNF